MQQRYYDPATLRFISTDPVSADPLNFNRYWYANNNPYTYVDPDGRASRRREESFALLGAFIAEKSGLISSETADGSRTSLTDGKIQSKKGGPPLQSSRAARREAMRREGVPTSRPASNARPTPGAPSTENRRQHVVEGADGKPRVVSHHEADEKHPNPHWHAAQPKLDDRRNILKGSHGELKYRSDGSSADYEAKPPEERK
jgi:uncharacterized protein RhaS with RHS repeats